MPKHLNSFTFSWGGKTIVVLTQYHPRTITLDGNDLIVHTNGWVEITHDGKWKHYTKTEVANRLQINV